MATPSRVLEIWTVYDRPKDYPDGFIARMYLIYPGFSVASPSTVTGATLAQVRAALPPGLYCMPRNPNDDPVIVESWI